jgi:hypothetical protein
MRGGEGIRFGAVDQQMNVFQNITWSDPPYQRLYQTITGLVTQGNSQD